MKQNERPHLEGKTVHFSRRLHLLTTDEIGNGIAYGERNHNLIVLIS